MGAPKALVDTTITASHKGAPSKFG